MGSANNKASFLLQAQFTHRLPTLVDVEPGGDRELEAHRPPSCQTTASSQAFVVKEDELTDVLFAIRCPEATEGSLG
jgi:hypothetical protein